MLLFFNVSRFRKKEAGLAPSSGIQLVLVSLLKLNALIFIKLIFSKLDQFKIVKKRNKKQKRDTQI